MPPTRVDRNERSPVGRADRVLRHVVLALSAISLVASHVMLIGYRTYANIDEAYASALAERVLSGYRLYEGAVSQRGPLMYYLYAGIAWLHGWDNIRALRVWALAFAMFQVLAVAWGATRLVSHRAGTLAASIMTYVLVVGLPPIDGIALHGETMQAPVFVIGATLAFLGTQRRGRLVHLFGAGLAFGLALSIKQSALLQPIPAALWILASARRNHRGLPLRELGVFAAGIALPVLVFVIHAAATGTLGGMLFYGFTYNLKVHLRPSTALLSRATLEPFTDMLKRMTGFVLVIAVTIGVGARWLYRRTRAAIAQRSLKALARGFGVRGYIGLSLLVGTAAATSQYRFFPHYYVPVLPFAAILVAGWIARRVRIAAHDAVRFSAAVLSVIVLVVSGFEAWAYEKIDGRVTHGGTVQNVARYLEATTRPDQKIFVWGFSPWLYGYSHRRPAGRYVFETYVTGFVPWFFDALPLEKSRVVPGSMEALLGDLDREDPAVVVDAGSVLLARPMRAYQAAADWLHAHYCFELRVSGYDIYRKKPAEGCASDVFPTVALPVDFNDGAAIVAMPIAVDEATSRPLCPRRVDEPVWFAGTKIPPAVAILLPPGREKDKIAHRESGVAYPEELAPPVSCTDR